MQAISCIDTYIHTYRVYQKVTNTSSHVCQCLNDVTNSTMYVYVLQASTTVAVLQAEAGKSESEQLLQQAQDNLKVLSFN